MSSSDELESKLILTEEEYETIKYSGYMKDDIELPEFKNVKGSKKKKRLIKKIENNYEITYEISGNNIDEVIDVEELSEHVRNNCQYIGESELFNECKYLTAISEKIDIIKTSIEEKEGEEQGEEEQGGGRRRKVRRKSKKKSNRRRRRKSGKKSRK